MPVSNRGEAPSIPTASAMTESAKPAARMRAATALVHGGTLRSSFDETSEALFLTQGFVYETM